MVLSRKHKCLFILVVLLTLLGGKNIAAQNDDSASEKTPVWNDSDWHRAKKGLDYNRPDGEKEEEETPEETDETEEVDEQLQSDSSGSISDWLTDIFTSPAGKLLSILVIILVLAFAITRIMISRGSGRNKKVIPLAEVSLADIEENLEESDLDRFLRLALETGDYKTAIRILYLGVIRRLHEMTWIKWKKDKNNDYLGEMRGRNGFRQFRELTLAYEVVWYGDTDINDDEYRKLDTVFRQYKNTLSSDEEK
jgi:hypothetical protein